MNELLNSLKEINWAISLLAGIPLAVFANLITPRVANYISKISKKRNNKRISKIKSELEEVELLVNNPEKINLETAISIFKVLLIFGFASLLAAIHVMEIITGPLAGFCFLFAVDTTVDQMTKFINCRDYERYKSDTDEILARLEKRFTEIDQ